MNLKEFLLLIFDRQYNRYPMIRESFMREWNIESTLNILAWTGYKCSRNELKKYVEYSCLDQGVRIRSVATPPWQYPRSDRIDTTFYRSSETPSRFLNYVKTWLEISTSVDGPITSILDISSSNSEYIFNMTICVKMHYTIANPLVLQGRLVYHPCIVSKIATDYPLYDFQTGSHNTLMIIPLSSVDYDNILSSVFNFFILMELSLSDIRKLYIEEVKDCYMTDIADEI